MISGLVLAAGKSARLGQPKQLLPFRGTTLLGWVLAQVSAAASLDEVIVVVGGAAADVRRRVDFGRARLVENPHFGEGCSSSYRAGLGALDPRADAVAVLLGDQPGIDAAIIDHVVQTWNRRRNERIAVAAYRDGPGHPLIFTRALFDQLAALKGDKAAWKILDAHPEWVHPVPVDRPKPPDVNTWEEYQAARSALD
ncbi:MAG TPA: nucleotidyltransferase family protein [Methylomirabilota bacterium]|nr:nucleotidyltransferase family protein [Methylomirabilota bacterium]